MSVTHVEEVQVGRSGDADSSGVGNVTRTFLVRTDDPYDDAFVVLEDPGLPGMFETHPTTPLFTVTKRSCQQVAEPALDWHATIEYSTQTPSEQQGKDQPPTLQPATVKATSVMANRTIRKDVNGKAIKNKAGSPFDPSPEIQVPHLVITVSRNEPAFHTGEVNTYVGKLNSATFMGFAAKYVMCTNLEAELMHDWSELYWRKTYTFEHNPYGWQLSLLNAGFDEKRADGKRYKIHIAGQDTSVPWPLASDGKALTQAQVDADGENYCDFDIMDTVDFNALGLPV